MAEKHELQKQLGSGRKAQRRASKRIEAAEQEAASLTHQLANARHQITALRGHEADLEAQVRADSHVAL